MGKIFVGDNGTVFNFTVSDDAGVVNLASASQIKVNFVRPDGTTFQKTLTITNAAAGQCNTSLTGTDLNIRGIYYFQLNVQFSDGKTFSGDKQSFEVDSKLT